jgi:hypothetical protein
MPYPRFSNVPTRLTPSITDRYGKGYSDHLSQMEKRNRDVALTSLNTLGLSARQIERLTGIGRNIVANAVSQSQQFY